MKTIKQKYLVRDETLVKGLVMFSKESVKIRSTNPIKNLKSC